MTEYIERRIAVDLIVDKMATGFIEDRFITPQKLQDLQDELEAIPAEDVAPVIHGKWVESDIPGSMLSKCTECGFRCGAYTFRFCPNCGAKMDLGEHEEERSIEG